MSAGDGGPLPRDETDAAAWVAGIRAMTLGQQVFAALWLVVGVASIAWGVANSETVQSVLGVVYIALGLAYIRVRVQAKP